MKRRSQWRFLGLFTALAVAACQSPAAEESRIRTLVFPAVTIEAGQEDDSLCQSITLGNEESIYVNSVAMSAGPGWHHSNWLFVAEELYPGPDGTWPCSDRGFDEVPAGLSGGVLYASSTRSEADEKTPRIWRGVS